MEGTKTPKNDKKKKGNKKKSQGTSSQGGKTLPAVKAPHPNSSFLTPQSKVNSQDKKAKTQQVPSERLCKMKELKNEILDLQRKVEASSLENQVLKQLQGQQERAIDRYRNSENNFEGLLARHDEEMRGLRGLLRLSQESERSLSKELKKVDAKLLKAKDALQTLLVLSEDKGLAEREELNDRLSILTEKLEEKDERIQLTVLCEQKLLSIKEDCTYQSIRKNLEIQLKLNKIIFSRQLANENRKVLQAGKITKNLKMEINSLHQKIKEKDRQLSIQNIYANRMPKALRDRRESVPQEHSLSVNRAVQVDKESFRAVLLSQHQETETSPIQTIKEQNSSEDKDEEAAANGAYSDGQSRTENQSTKKILLPESSNRKHRAKLMKHHEKDERNKELKGKNSFCNNSGAGAVSRDNHSSSHSRNEDREV